MKILITGASGFIGSKLIKKAIIDFGKENIVALSSRKIDGCTTLIYPTFEFNAKDFKGFDFSNIDVLVHVGAFIPKSGSQANAISNCNNNIYFTSSLMNLPLSNLKKIVFSSTIDVYNINEKISESTQIQPQSLYGDSKYYCEKILESYSQQNNIDLQILRLGHVYGPGEESYAKIIPITISNIIKNKFIEIWGDGFEVRSFIYIDDVVISIINAMKSDVHDNPINVVSGTSTKIIDLINALIKMSKKDVSLTYKASNHIKRNYVFDNSLLLKTLLSQETELNIGLESEYQYMKSLYEDCI